MPLVCSFVFLCLIHFSYCTRLFTFHPLYRRSFTNVRQRGIFIFQFGFEYFLTASRFCLFIYSVAFLSLKPTIIIIRSVSPFFWISFRQIYTLLYPPFSTRDHIERHPKQFSHTKLYLFFSATYLKNPNLLAVVEDCVQFWILSCILTFDLKSPEFDPHSLTVHLNDDDIL